MVYEDIIIYGAINVYEAYGKYRGRRNVRHFRELLESNKFARKKYSLYSEFIYYHYYIYISIFDLEIL